MLKSSTTGKIIRSFGPGIITAALIFGPGSLTIASKLGSGYYYQLLWLVILSTFFMVLFTLMSAKYGIVVDRSMIQTIREKYGMFYSALIGICTAIATVSFQTGNAIGAGLAIGGMVNMKPTVWVTMFSIIAILFLFNRSFYKILEKIMILMVIIMVLSFLTTLIISRPDLSEILKGFIPGIPAGSEFLSIALIASSFSLAGAFFQSYLVQEKGWERREAGKSIRESISGIILLGFISTIVMVAAGAVLYTRNIDVVSAADMGRVLEPLFGPFAYYIFMIGLFAASFSSLIGNATLGGTILSDTFGLGKELSSWPVRSLIMLIIATGATIAIVFGRHGLQLIVVAQAFTVLVSPVIAIMIFQITRNRKIMGELKNSPIIQVLSALGITFLLLLTFSYLYLHLFR